MERKSINQTLDLLALALVVLAILLQEPHKWLLALAALLLAGSALWANPVTDFVARAWLELAKLLGRISTAVLLAAVFYLVVTPLAVAFRLFNRELAQRFFARGRASMFSDPPEPWDGETFRRTW